MGAKEVTSCFNRARFLRGVCFLVPSRIRELAFDWNRVAILELHADISIRVENFGSTASIESAGEPRHVLGQDYRELCETEDAFGDARELL
mgnify:CR=1 FL=1